MELRCDNIQYSIEGSRILNGISLGVSNNEFHTILGPNGCGKTTFLKTVYRITKPDLGAIYLDGKPLDNISIRKSAQNMAVVAQFNNLNFDCSVLDEPTNHLDIKYQLEILKIVKKLNVNVLAVLHDIQLACRFSDYIYLIKDGRIRYKGKPEEVITKDNMREIYDVECEVINRGSNQILIQYT